MRLEPVVQLFRGRMAVTDPKWTFDEVYKSLLRAVGYDYLLSLYLPTKRIVRFISATKKNAKPAGIANVSTHVVSLVAPNRITSQSGQKKPSQVNASTKINFLTFM